LKIAQVTSFFWPKKYGSNELVICRELVKRGHQVTVLTASKPSDDYKMLAEDAPRKERFEGFNIERFPPSLTFGNIFSMPSLLPYLMRNDFDVIHTHEFFAPCSFYSAVASRLKGSPLIITQHNDELFESHLKTLLYHSDASTIGKAALYQASKIIALSKSIDEHLLKFGADKEKIEIIPNGVDAEEFNPNKPNYLLDKLDISGKIVLFVGRFIEVKGIKYLLQAFDEVANKVPDAKIVFVGSGLQEKEIRDLQSRHENRVFVLNMVNHSEMPNIYVGCDVFVMPSLEERFGNCVLEAMAAGKPVIGSNVGGMKETIAHGETGFHVQPRNSKQIADYLIELLQNERLAKQMGRNARLKAAHDYNNTKLVKQIESIYFSARQQ
jgi:alpha-maltose-1-phosphate synthase